MVTHRLLPINTFITTVQCILSVTGSLGVILLFAGTPQLIYSPQLKPISLATFLLGALLITLMVGGNAYINYKYRYLIDNSAGATSNLPEDKPPNYDDLDLVEDGSPPSYDSHFIGNPPKYEDVSLEAVQIAANPAIVPALSTTTDLPPCPPYSEINTSIDVITPSTTTHQKITPVHSLPNSNSYCLDNRLRKYSRKSSSPQLNQTGENKNIVSESQSSTTVSSDSKEFIEIDISKDYKLVFTNSTDL